MKEITVKCPAKINLFFNIIGLDERNYHLVHGLNQSISIYDILTIKINNTNSINIKCNDSSIPTDEKNSIYKAAKLFLDYTKITTGLDIYLEKNIPTEAGLGGESTDAAGTISALNIIFNTNLSKEELNKISYQTSCDVPFCIEGGSKEVKGCGQIVIPWQNPYSYYLVITPNIGHSTKEMFNLYDNKITKYKKLKPTIGHNDFHLILNNDIKDLITKIKKETKAKTAMLTGSGSSIIAIFNNKDELDNAYNIIKNELNNTYKIAKTQNVSGIEEIKK